MDLHEIDLNLLVVFNQLLLERRVSRVAEVLGVSQPAVSNSLAKLRRLFGDELFLRTPRGMEPTPFAQQLAETVSQALGLIHDYEQLGFGWNVEQLRPRDRATGLYRRHDRHRRDLLPAHPDRAPGA